MKYNLLIVRNRFKKKLKLQSGLEWFKKNTPLDVVIADEISTDFDVTTAKIANATYKGVMCGEDIIPKLRTVVPEGKYHAVVFIYGNSLDGIRVNVAPVMPIYEGTNLIQLINYDDNGKTLNHEIFHTFFQRIRRQGIVIDDPMDSVTIDGKVYPYFNNKSLKDKPSNRTIAIERLAPYWNQVINIPLATPNKPVVKSNPVVEITRQVGVVGETLGELKVNGFSCKTLELPLVANMTNISCIPAGEYQVKWTFSPRLLKYTYEVQGVPNRTGIRIHSANYYYELKGCIALGDKLTDLNSDGKLDILNSKATLKNFEDKMERKPFTLVIK